MSAPEPEKPPSGSQPYDPDRPGASTGWPPDPPGGAPAGPPAAAGPVTGGPVTGGPVGTGPVAGGRTPDRPPRRTRTRRAVLEWVAILVVAVLAAVVLRSFVVQPYFIPSGSMEPTLMIGDKVLVNKLSYDFHSVHRGDVIVFKKPPNDYSPGIKDLIKRVIGLPGETISARGGSVYIDGRPLPEPWLPKGTTTANFAPVHVPAGDYFVMGDNRGNSADSRVIGPISGSLIVGRAFLIIWPVGRITTL
ncbi:MAG TPA: signal peptidase I [Acidimicrobiales bacterium]|nr:signal peptidase I [Acidimicrobiales bacterium]